VECQRVLFLFWWNKEQPATEVSCARGRTDRGETKGKTDGRAKHTWWSFEPSCDDRKVNYESKKRVVRERVYGCERTWSVSKGKAPIIGASGQPTLLERERRNRVSERGVCQSKLRLSVVVCLSVHPSCLCSSCSCLLVLVLLLPSVPAASSLSWPVHGLAVKNTTLEGDRTIRYESLQHN